MKKTSKDFYNYVLEESSDPDFTRKIGEMYKAFQAGTYCPICGGRDIGITVEPHAVMWCRNCEGYRDVVLDRITKVDYNDVEILHKEKIIDILRNNKDI